MLTKCKRSPFSAGRVCVDLPLGVQLVDDLPVKLGSPQEVLRLLRGCRLELPAAVGSAVLRWLRRRLWAGPLRREAPPAVQITATADLDQGDVLDLRTGKLRKA